MCYALTQCNTTQRRALRTISLPASSISLSLPHPLVALPIVLVDLLSLGGRPLIITHRFFWDTFFITFPPPHVLPLLLSGPITSLILNRGRVVSRSIRHDHGCHGGTDGAAQRTAAPHLLAITAFVSTRGGVSNEFRHDYGCYGGTDGAIGCTTGPHLPAVAGCGNRLDLFDGTIWILGGRRVYLLTLYSVRTVPYGAASE